MRRYWRGGGAVRTGLDKITVTEDVFHKEKVKIFFVEHLDSMNGFQREVFGGLLHARPGLSLLLVNTASPSSTVVRRMLPLARNFRSNNSKPTAGIDSNVRFLPHLSISPTPITYLMRPFAVPISDVLGLEQPILPG